MNIVTVGREGGQEDRDFAKSRHSNLHRKPLSIHFYDSIFKLYITYIYNSEPLNRLLQCRDNESLILVSLETSRVKENW